MEMELEEVIVDGIAIRQKDGNVLVICIKLCGTSRLMPQQEACLLHRVPSVKVFSSHLIYPS